MVLGNPLGVSYEGNRSNIISIQVGITSNTSYQNIGINATDMSGETFSYDPDLVSISNGVITFQKNCNIRYGIYGRGNTSTNGYARYLYYRLMRNGSSIASSTSVGNGGTTVTNTLSMNAGDTLVLQIAHSTGAAVSCWFEILKN